MLEIITLRQSVRSHTLFGIVRQQISQTLVGNGDEWSASLCPTAPPAELLLVTAPAADPLLESGPGAEPLLANVALARDEFNDKYEDNDADFELRWIHIFTGYLFIYFEP